MVAGVAATTPVFWYGIPYFHNTSTTGTYLGINRTQNYVVANGVAAGGAPLSLPMIRASISRVEQSLGSDALKSQVWHAHLRRSRHMKRWALPEQEWTHGRRVRCTGNYDGVTSNQNVSS